jgi:phospholipid/cholesterol/gamma-HCH transport system substrate-binding protein
MKKISNEVKVGVVTIITILVFIWLYSFLKGKDFFSNSAYYYTIYDKIGGLAESSPVEINGFKVGVVQSIEFQNPENGKLIATFSVSKDFKLPKNTVAEIVPVSLLGGMKVQFVYGNGPGTYSDGDTIPGVLAESVTDKIETEFLPLKDKISKLVSTLDSVISSVNEVMDKGFKDNLKATLANLNNTTGSIDRIVGSKEKELKSTLESAEKFSRMLSENTGKMNKTFSNLESITDTLAAADIFTSVAKLKESLEQAAIMLDNMNKGKGTAGQFLTNDTLYTNLSNSMESLNLLLQDLKANPKRYVSVSVFGKKSDPKK